MSEATSGFTVDLQKEVLIAQSYSVLALSSVIQYLSLQHGVGFADDFTIFGDKEMSDGTPRFKVLLVTNLNVALSSLTQEVDLVIKGAEKLYHKNFPKDGDKDNVTGLLRNKSRNDGNQYVLVCLYGFLKSKPGELVCGIEVVSAALGVIANDPGGYVGYLATSNTTYAKSKFGKTADSNPFARRGMAKFVLILFHLISHWKSYSNATEALFLHCNEDKVSLFEKLGFVHIKNVRDKNVWPNAIKRLHPVIGIIASDIRKFKLQAMRIDKAIDGQLKKELHLTLSVDPNLSSTLATQDTEKEDQQVTEARYPAALERRDVEAHGNELEQQQRLLDDAAKLSDQRLKLFNIIRNYHKQKADQKKSQAPPPLKSLTEGTDKGAAHASESVSVDPLLLSTTTTQGTDKEDLVRATRGNKDDQHQPSIPNNDDGSSAAFETATGLGLLYRPIPEVEEANESFGAVEVHGSGLTTLANVAFSVRGKRSDKAEDLVNLASTKIPKKPKHQLPKRQLQKNKTAIGDGLRRRIDDAFARRSSMTLTSEMKKAIQTSYKQIWTDEAWAPVQSIIDELLDKADQDRFKKILESTGTKFNTTFEQLLYDFYLQELSHFNREEMPEIDDDFRDKIEEIAGGMLPERLWSLAIEYVNGLVDPGPPLELSDELMEEIKKIRATSTGRIRIVQELEKRLKISLSPAFFQLVNQYYLTLATAGVSTSNVNPDSDNLPSKDTSVAGDDNTEEDREAQPDTSSGSGQRNNEGTNMQSEQAEVASTVMPYSTSSKEKPQTPAKRSSSSKEKPQTPSKRSGYYTEVEVTITSCSSCKRDLITDGKVQKCLRCKNLVHNECGTSYKRFDNHNDTESQECLCKTCIETESIFLCYNCGRETNAATYRVSVQTAGGDSKLTLLWNAKVRRERSSDEAPLERRPKKVKLSAEEEAEERLNKAKDLQHWLIGITSVKYMRTAEKYQVKSLVDGVEQQKQLHKQFVEDEILLMNKDFITLVRTNRTTFHDVPSTVKQNVVLRDELWSGPITLYSTYQKCITGKEWMKIKVSHNAKNVKEMPDNLEDWEFVQESSKLTQGQRQYYISLVDEDKTKVEFVPKYFIFLWTLQVMQNEMDILMKEAWKKPNKWVCIQQGKARYDSGKATNLLTTTYENKFLQNGEATCVVTSLANAMAYINDMKAADALMCRRKESLLTTRRLQFVANEMAQLNYTVSKLRHFDILGNTSKWPIICALRGSDGGTTHAVTVCGEVLFDSNTTVALQLNRDNLNWCCGSDGVAVKYVEVYLAYRFEFRTKNALPKHFKNV